MFRTTIMLPEPLKKRAETVAAARGLSLGELLRTSLQTFLDKEERKWTEDPMIEGNYNVLREPAPSDVSGNLDRYLYGPQS